MAFAPNGNHAYVTDGDAGTSTLSQISTASYTVTATITGFSTPAAVAINPHMQNG